MPLGDVEVHDVWSDEVLDTFRLFIGRCGEQPKTTVLVTDANGLFGMSVDTVRLMQLPGLLPSVLIVGIGYPRAATIRDTVAIRARDLTPTRSACDGSGGGDAFLRFIRRELLPWVEQRFPSSLGDIVYFGHSLGGLFGVHALLDDVPAFDRFIISSPSLWWDHYVEFEREERRASSHSGLVATVYFGIGAEETDEGRRREAINLPADDPAKPPPTHLDMVDDLVRFADRLGARRYPNLELELAVFPDEFHATVPAAVLSHGLRHLFRCG
jgi:ferri-bacillibactin esterase